MAIVWGALKVRSGEQPGRSPVKFGFYSVPTFFSTHFVTVVGKWQIGCVYIYFLCVSVQHRLGTLETHQRQWLICRRWPNMFKTLLVLVNYNCSFFLSIQNKLPRHKMSLNAPLLQLTISPCPNFNINTVFLCELSFYSLYSFLD